MSNQPNLLQPDDFDSMEEAIAARDLDHLEQSEPGWSGEGEELWISDAEADEDAMTSAGMGENESYGDFGGDE